MKKTKNKDHVFFSGINKEKEVFEIIESEIGLDHNDFRKRIKEELNFLGYDHCDLAEAIYIETHRLSSYLKGKNNLSSTEILRIKKRLGM